MKVQQNSQKNSALKDFKNISLKDTIQTTCEQFLIKHKAPNGYSYEFESFKRNVIAIWLRHHAVYDYNLGKSIRTIWGFYNSKTKSYHSPINSSTVGNVVNIEDTRNYTAMPIKQTSLQAAFV